MKFPDEAGLDPNVGLRAPAQTLHMPIRTLIRLPVHMPIHIHIPHMHTHMHIYIYIHVPICVSICRPMPLPVHEHMHIHVHMPGHIHYTVLEYLGARKGAKEPADASAG